MTDDNYFDELSKLDVSKYVEKKGKFSYLSWPFAVETLGKMHPTATWEIVRFDGLPFLNTEFGVFVEVSVTIEGVTKGQLHPVLDNRNSPIAKPTSFQINTSIQRALVKAIALHGLGLYIYAGEDLPTETKKPCDDKELSKIADDIKKHIENDDEWGVHQVWHETTKEEKELLWVAVTKGGFFKTAEKEYIRKCKTLKPEPEQ
jgi:hypothetical protein